MQIGEHEFDRCPVLYVEPEDQHMVALWRRGGFERLEAFDEERLPARVGAAVVYLNELRAEVGAAVAPPAEEVADG